MNILAGVPVSRLEPATARRRRTSSSSPPPSSPPTTTSPPSASGSRRCCNEHEHARPPHRRRHRPASPRPRARRCFPTSRCCSRSATPSTRASICPTSRSTTRRLGGFARKIAARSRRPHRARGDAPLRAVVAPQLLDRQRNVSARLVHHEAQPAAQREDGAAPRLRRHPPAAAGLDRAGRARADAASSATG